MSAPAWYREAVAAYGERVAAGTVTEAQAGHAIAAILAGHPEFLAAIAGRDVGKWAKAHGQGDLFQEALFPAIPAVMSVSPGVKVRVADMTAADLEKAKVMLTVRTRNAERAAVRERREFGRFYRAVRPLMTDGVTVADAVAQLAAQFAA